MYTVLKWVIGIFLFLLIIIIHEFGHFIMAKANKIKVNEFSVGMGPRLFGIQGKETLYSFRLLPIGGYCAMEGEDAESSDPNSFGSKKVWQRLIVVVAGALFNIILGLIFMVIVQGQEKMYTTTTVAVFEDNAQSQQSGLMVNDKILRVGDYRTFTATDISFAMQLDEDGVMDYVVLRDGEKITVKNVTFDRVETEDGMATVFDYRVYPEKRNVWTVLKYSFSETVSMCRIVYKSFGMLFTGGVKFTDLTGPVGTASVIGQAADIGFKASFMEGINNILYVMALLTINLGVFNLFPIPALDGGRIVFLLIELVRGKPINQKYEGWIHAAGFALLIGLVIIVTFNDVARLVGI